MDDRGRAILLRLFKLGISLAYFAGREIRTLARRVTGSQIAGTCTVLYYHAISIENRARFARQMDELKRLTTPIHVDFKGRLNDETRYAGITFDDGYENLIGAALPELKIRNIPCVIFIIADAPGEIPIWMRAQADALSQQRLMTVEEIRGLSPDLIAIGAHTLTHPNLLLLEEVEAAREIRESRARLESTLNREVKLFSFPYGAFNERLVDVCREAGYERIFTTLPFPALSEPGEFVTGRVWAEPTDWPLEFRLKLLGGYAWLPKAFSLKRRILRNRLTARFLGARSRLQVETLHRHVQ
jgi:peptidoglycan/xylan/chitin deacetylase (PgdA/CDA1 family)